MNDAQRFFFPSLNRHVCVVLREAADAIQEAHASVRALHRLGVQEPVLEALLPPSARAQQRPTWMRVSGATLTLRIPSEHGWLESAPYALDTLFRELEAEPAAG